MRWLGGRRKQGSAEDVRCSFCSKGIPKISKLFTGPDGACICNECLKTCEEILWDTEKKQSTQKKQLQEKREILRCSFCLRTEDEVHQLIAGPEVYICGDCALRFGKET